MTGITLSAEQIRKAPPEIRHWIEHELGASPSLQAHGTESQRPAAQLADCNHDELTAMLSLIHEVFPAVNVFFELGREGTSLAQDRLEAYRLSDIQHHTQLQSVAQVISCLNFINGAFLRVRGGSGTPFYAADDKFCFIATQTQQNIRRLWLELLDRGEAVVNPLETTHPTPAR